MSLHALADHMAARGRGPDTTLVHMAPQEVAGLQALALAHGGSLTINPDTGLPEAGFLKKLLPALAGFALNAFAPGFGTAIGGMLGVGGAAGTAIGLGGITGLATGNLQKGLMAGLGAYGGASLAGGVMGAGATSGLESALSNAGTAEGLQGEAFNKFLTSDANPALMSNADKLSSGFGAITKDPSAFGNFAKQNAGSLLAVTSPLLADEGVQTVTKLDNPGLIRNFDYDPITQRARALNPVRVKDLGYADGGSVGAPKTVTQMPGSNPYKDSQAAYEYLMGIAPKAPQQNTQPQASFNPAAEGRYAWDYDKKAYTWIPANPVAETKPTRVSDYNPYEYGGGFGGMGGDSGSVGSGGSSGGGFGSSADSNAANSITGMAGPVNSSIAVSDMGTVSDAAAAEAAASAIGMAESANAIGVDNGSISDGVTSGPGPGDGGVSGGGGGGAADSGGVGVGIGDGGATGSGAVGDSGVGAGDGGVSGGGGGGPAGDGEANGGLMRLHKKFAEGGAARTQDGSSQAAYDYLMGVTNTTRPAAPAVTSTSSGLVGGVIGDITNAVRKAIKTNSTAGGEINPPTPLTMTGPDLPPGSGGGAPELNGGITTLPTTPVETNYYPRQVAPDVFDNRRVRKYSDDYSHLVEAANGGLMSPGYAMGGGLGSLGGYSDGGRLLRGPGDGVSDSIPAMIGTKQPARLADGEFVVPARIVSELGNGSTEAGARKLYKMMDRIQAARSKTVGKGRVAKNSRSEKHLPA